MISLHMFLGKRTRSPSILAPVYEMASEELLTTIETNAETLLEETGIDFRDDPNSSLAIS
jgi:trimethylamine:corrinoid methyltransferase-like protein